MLFLVPEASRHAAATRATFGRTAATGLQHIHAGTNTHQRFLMAMAMEHHFRAGACFPRDAEVVGRFQLRQPFIQHEAVLGHEANILIIRQEIAILIAQGEDTARFGADNRDALARVICQKRDILAGALASNVDQTLAQCRATTACATLFQHGLKSCRFDQLHGGETDFREVVGREGIVEIHHLAAFHLCHRILLAPAAEMLHEVLGHER